MVGYFQFKKFNEITPNKNKILISFKFKGTERNKIIVNSKK